MAVWTPHRDRVPQQEQAPQPQPEQHEPVLRDPEPEDLSKRDYVAILKRAATEAKDDHITNYAAALAYYAFLAIPSALLIAVGVFGLVTTPQDVASLVDKLGSIVPTQAETLLGDS